MTVDTFLNSERLYEDSDPDPHDPCDWWHFCKIQGGSEGRGFACDFSRGSFVTSQFGSLVTSCFLWSRNAELSLFSENRVTPNP